MYEGRTVLMDWYKRYMGDYASDTAHLTLLEHGAYNMLLDHYYATEKPLPLDITRIHRIVRATTDQEKEAVNSVLNEYFRETEDGYVQDKCDEVIEKYQNQAETNRRIARERTVTRIVGRPLNEDATYPETRNQKPDTRNQNQKKPITSGKPDYRQDAINILDFLNERTGRNYQPVDSNIKLITSRLKEGFTVTQCRQVVAKKCREWREGGKRDKMDEYLRPKTLFNATNFANYSGELGERDGEN